MIWGWRTQRANTFHPYLKNVPHLLSRTTSCNTFGAEADKGSPGLMWFYLIYIYINVCVSLSVCACGGLYVCLPCVCVWLWIAVWGTMQHVKPMWEVWRQGICCSQMNKEENCYSFVYTTFIVSLFSLFNFSIGAEIDICPKIWRGSPNHRAITVVWTSMIHWDVRIWRQNTVKGVSHQCVQEPLTFLVLL